LIAGGKLKEYAENHWITPNTGAADEVGFKALPGGRADVDAAFELLQLNGFFWLQDEGANITNWVLPTSNALIVLYQNLHLLGKGNFSTSGFYWASDEFGSISAMAFSFLTGGVTFKSKSELHKVRPIRSFTDVVGAYSIGDVGPSNGLIFAIDAGLMYYEVYNSDLSSGKAWSNIINVAVTGTQFNMSYSEANTNLIIAQPGHTDSAAKLCYDLVVSGLTAKYYSLAYNSAEVTKGVALKTNYHSVRLIKTSGAASPQSPSYITNILLNGNCIDKETRKLYVFYLDSYHNSAWIIEIGIDDRVQTVVYYDHDNNIGFDPKHKIWNPRVINGRIIWTDGLEHHIYQIDIKRAKKSYYFGIGYNPLHPTVEWNGATVFLQYQIVSYGKYLYKALQNSQNVEPGTDALKWQILCLIEDAYYSMNVENFYFAPMPPKTAPVVQYVSDDNRRINNLKQTLFQFAYRYIYMDWRKSTFSPASIVSLPQAEEETASGLANEQISLNNSLQIFVNVGGEEVRAIEVVARSSDDPSTWFLIETIEKFTAEERGNEVSILQMNEYPIVSISVPEATVVNLSTVAAPAPSSVAISVPAPNVIASTIGIADNNLTFTADEFGSGDEKTSALSWTPALATSIILENGCVVNGIPWCVVTDDTLAPLAVGATINIGTASLHFYPSAANTGGLRSGIIKVRGQYGDVDEIRITQYAPVTPPIGSVLIDPGDVSGLTLLTRSAVPVVNTGLVNIVLTPDHPDYNEGYRFLMRWRATKNGVAVGSGSFWITDEVLSSTVEAIQIVLTQASLNGETVNIYVSADDMQEISVTSDKASASISVPAPTVINSVCSPGVAGLLWTASEGGSSAVRYVAIDCGQSVQMRVTAYPTWMTLLDSDGNDLKGGHYIINGENLRFYPTNINGSSALTGTITFLNEYGDTASINVTHQAAIVAIPPTLQISGSDTTGLSFMVGRYRQATVVQATNLINLLATFESTSQVPDAYFTVYWNATVNGIPKGSGNFTARNAREYTGDISTYDVSTTLALNPGTVLDIQNTIVISFAGNAI